ncbi:MAG: hypothetical protein ACLFRP_00275 [Puniceicoccaceae bacterium]
MTPAVSKRAFVSGLRWVGLFLSYALGIVAVGALTGGGVFLLLGKLFVPDESFGWLGATGLRVGAILAGVWAPGVAIVLCFVRGKRERDRLRGKTTP